MSTRWQQAWDDAEPRLRSWKDFWTPSNAGPRVLRVGQLDAELLDEELVQTLQEPLAKALGIVNAAVRSKLEPELALIIRLTLYKFSLWDLGATYGAKLQDLRYSCKKSSASSLAPSGLPKRTLVLHACLTVLVPYFHTRIRSHALSNAWPDTPSSDKRKKAWNLLSNMESIHSASALLSFVVFLWNGRYRTLADRLLSMCLVPSRRFTNRQVSYEFMNRQMVWHAFTEFLILLLPVFGSRAFRRTYNQISSRIRHIEWSSILPSKPALASESSSLKVMQKKKGKYINLPSNQCAICADNASFGLSTLAGMGSTSADSNPFNVYMDSASAISTMQNNNADSDADGPPTHPITTPYRASCGHTFCYFCLSERLLRAVDDGDDGWPCLRCAEVVRSCERENAICDDDSARTSDGWASDEEELASFESDMDMSTYSEI